MASIKTYFDDLQIIPKSELPPGKTFGIRYKTFNFFAPKFITFLKDYLTKRGVTFIRRKLSHIDEAAAFAPETTTVFNCTGISARELPGVEDSKVFPTRGQVVVVRAPHVRENRCFWESGTATYIIPRPSSGGLVILGGFQQKYVGVGDTFGYETANILTRCTTLMPELLLQKGKNGTKKIDLSELEIVREAAGLRPSREGGVRIEAEVKKVGEKSIRLIHNYGAGGTGYQAGYGMALDAVDLFTNGQSKL